ncbi:MAG: acyl-ACP--UDP-N-acetylglucosamine O-acyltransferase [Gammaproteobacteria bacterium]|nr:acyl-ACP--UDP-N-acetylglucosamine O-acyltransferase [Gammaproteobacteria bacterium]
MIHPSAIIDPSAQLADDVEVGPYSIIGANVEIDAGTWIGPHVVINGPTRIGKQNRIYQFSSLGDAPQDKKYAGEETTLEIGDRNVIREYCTFNRGTTQDVGVTRLGNDNWIMAYVHLAHDCQVGNDTIFANGATLAGHVEVEDKVIFGAFTVIHQFCRVGYHAFSGMGTVIKADVPPYTMLNGNPAEPHGINLEGLKRSGMTKEQIKALRDAYKIIYKSGNRLQEAIEQLDELSIQFDVVKRLPDFLRQSSRGIIR